MYSAISNRFSADHLAVRDDWNEGDFFQAGEEDPFPSSALQPWGYSKQRADYNEYYPHQQSYSDDQDDDNDSISAQTGGRFVESGERSVPTVAATVDSSLSSTFTSLHMNHPMSSTGHYFSGQASLGLSSLSPDADDSLGTSEQCCYSPERSHPPISALAYAPLSVTSCDKSPGQRGVPICDFSKANPRQIALADGLSTAIGSDDGCSTIASDDILEECFAEFEQSMESYVRAHHGPILAEYQVTPQAAVQELLRLEAPTLSFPDSSSSGDVRSGKSPHRRAHWREGGLAQSQKNPLKALHQFHNDPGPIRGFSPNQGDKKPTRQHLKQTTAEKQFYPLACASTETTMMTSFSTSSSFHPNPSREEDDGNLVSSSSWPEVQEEIKRELSRYSGISDEEQMCRQIETCFSRQSNRKREMAAAFLYGLRLRKERHDVALQGVDSENPRELRQGQGKPKDSDATAKPQPTRQMQQTSREQIEKQARSAAFRKRWLAKQKTETEALGDTQTVASTALTSLSCRELSMRRYQMSYLKLKQQREERPKKKEASATDEHSEESNRSTDANDEIQRLLEELQQSQLRQKKLEERLKQAGVVLADDIPYQVAKDQVARISERMNEIGSSEAQHDDPTVQKSLREEYYGLEKDMEKYINALLLTDEFMEEQKALEEAWEAQQVEENRYAVMQIRRWMPVGIRKWTQQQLERMGIPTAMVRKFQRTNVLQLLRRDPQVIARWHPCNLESLRLSGLTLTERRALHHHLLLVSKELSRRGSDPLTERKHVWINMMRSNFKEALERFQQHVGSTDGNDGEDHKCGLLGKQCPVRANQAIDYCVGDGLGFPADDVYEDSSPDAEVPVVSTLPAQDDSPKPRMDTKLINARAESPGKGRNPPAKRVPPTNLLEAIGARLQKG